MSYTAYQADAGRNWPLSALEIESGEVKFWHVPPGYSVLGLACFTVPYGIEFGHVDWGALQVEVPESFREGWIGSRHFAREPMATYFNVNDSANGFVTLLEYTENDGTSETWFIYNPNNSRIMVGVDASIYYNSGEFFGLAQDMIVLDAQQSQRLEIESNPQYQTRLLDGFWVIPDY